MIPHYPVGNTGIQVYVDPTVPDLMFFNAVGEGLEGILTIKIK